MILAGDIGGTNSRLALFDQGSDRLRLKVEATYFSRGHRGLDEILRRFLSETGATVQTACCGIAGPVVHGRVVASNLPWVADAGEISRQTGIPSVFLINDVQAHASGIDDLEAEDFISLNSAPSAEGNAALIAAGTGLGEGGLFWDGKQRHAFAAEGGHADFGPRNDLEVKLHVHLIQKFGHVSCERVLSGPGLKNIYDFLRDSGLDSEPGWLKDELRTAPDPVAVISRYGLASKSAICERALDIFTAVYGAEAGNIALRMFATGGVFLTGGIAAKILPKLQSPIFATAFVDKGRMKPLLESIPVKVIMNDRVGLIGAARYVMQQPVR